MEWVPLTVRGREESARPTPSEGCLHSTVLLLLLLRLVRSRTLSGQGSRSVGDAGCCGNFPPAQRHTSFHNDDTLTCEQVPVTAARLGRRGGLLGRRAGPSLLPCLRCYAPSRPPAATPSCLTWAARRSWRRTWPPLRRPWPRLPPHSSVGGLQRFPPDPEGESRDIWRTVRRPRAGPTHLPRSQRREGRASERSWQASSPKMAEPRGRRRWELGGKGRVAWSPPPDRTQL